MPLINNNIYTEKRATELDHYTRRSPIQSLSWQLNYKARTLSSPRTRPLHPVESLLLAGESRVKCDAHESDKRNAL